MKHLNTFVIIGLSIIIATLFIHVYNLKQEVKRNNISWEVMLSMTTPEIETVFLEEVDKRLNE